MFVQSTGAGRNAFGGIRHPMVDAPLATHAGWSLRASGYGEGDLFTIQGADDPVRCHRSRKAARRRSAGRRSKRATHRARPGLRDWLRRRIASSPSDYRYPRTAIGCWQRPARSWDVCQAL